MVSTMVSAMDTTVATTMSSTMGLSSMGSAAGPNRRLRRREAGLLPTRLSPRKTRRARKTPVAFGSPCVDEALLLQHLPQVRVIAKQIRERYRCPAELDDLVGYGTIGLMKAVKCFDPARGVLLKTYAEHRIRGAILDGLRGMNWLSRSACRRKAQYQKRLSETEESAAGPVPIASREASGASGDARQPAAVSAYVTLETPLLEIVCGGWDMEDLEEISEKAGWRQREDGFRNPEALYEQKERVSRLGEAVSRLPRRDREVIELYYRRDLNMKEIAEILHLHQSRISQLHSGAIRRLRNSLSEVRTADPAASGSVLEALPQCR
jgi:RNA polymerase sigma factor FliA